MAAKIMLVEDDTNLSEIYKARLEAEGYQISSAKDGEEALALAVKEHPDLIVSDIMMPKISGFDMLDILRGTPGIEATKVIMMTALGQSEDKSRAEKLGADRYLVKSQVTLEDVVKTIHEVLEGSSPEEASMLQADISSAPSQPATAAPATSVSAAPAATTPVTQPITVAPMPVAIDTVTQPPLDSSALSSPQSAPTSSATDSSPVGQSSQAESADIKNQIQGFLNPTPVDDTNSSPLTPVSPAQPDVVTVQPSSPPLNSVVTPTNPPEQPENNNVNITGKKIIPTDNLNRPNIYSLLAKEEAKQPTQDTPPADPQQQNTIDPNSIAL